MALLLFSWLFIVSSFPGTTTISSTTPLHPFYVSVTEMNYNAADKAFEISCKIFTDDFEEAISRESLVKVDLINTKDKAAADKYVAAYLERHLQLKIDGKPVKLEFVGFERESEAVWSYLQISNMNAPKKVEIMNNILFESFAEQINLLHVTVNGDRKSTKLNNPSANVKFEF